MKIPFCEAYKISSTLELLRNRIKPEGIIGIIIFQLYGLDGVQRRESSPLLEKTDAETCVLPQFNTEIRHSKPCERWVLQKGIKV